MSEKITGGRFKSKAIAEFFLAAARRYDLAPPVDHKDEDGNPVTLSVIEAEPGNWAIVAQVGSSKMGMPDGIAAAVIESCIRDNRIGELQALLADEKRRQAALVSSAPQG